MHKSTATLLGHVIVGHGPEPVIVLHEWLGDHRNYTGIVAYLDKAKYTYIFADLRGYGLSRGMTGAYTVDEVASDVLRVADHYGYRHFSLVGHSMSGMVVQYLMLKVPDRLDRVVAISPVPATGFKTDAAGLAKLAAVVTDDAAANAATDGRTGKRYTQAFLDQKLAVIRGAAPEAMRGYLKMFTTTDFSAQLNGLETPLTVICGAQDIPAYHKEAIEPLFRPWYRNMTVETISDAGHYSMIETPVLLATLVERGLASGSSATQ
ncbi:MAG TPA: alpha/beta hydrolase [Stellaceae bacterium]|nr:alpha/beta hydrolase [Stellaceae bacterium]